MPTKHLPVGGSTAERTINCPAWLKRFKELNPTNKSNDYADEGTLLHDVMEKLYADGEKFEEQLGKTTYKNFVFYPLHEVQFLVLMKYK